MIHINNINKKSISIETHCGTLILPPHQNEYKCFKIDIKSPAEHIINGIQYEGEMKFYYKIKDKEVYDEDTKDYVALVLLLKADNEITYNNPWLDIFNNSIKKVISSFDNNIKAKNNSNNLNSSYANNKDFKDKNSDLIINNVNNKTDIDFKEEISLPSLDYLLNKAKQEELKIRSLYNPQDNTELPEDVFLDSAVQEFHYNKHFPLNSFYLYNGSFTIPSCEENFTYIINKEIINVKFDEIVKISDFISKYISNNGNIRNTQPSNNRVIAKYESKKIDVKMKLVKQTSSNSSNVSEKNSNRKIRDIEQKSKDNYNDISFLQQNDLVIKTEKLLDEEDYSDYLQRVDELLDKSSNINEIDLSSI